ncbi:MAG: hypothetical protein IPN74_12750 [Haliscomenobacter sp.]|nr:hypothetical protein [Haliscomenobacter sp.]
MIKPFLARRDIKRYQTPDQTRYILFIPWHFPLHNDSTIVGASKEAERQFEINYPAIYKHLLSYKELLEKRNKAETGVRYEWYALQRCAATYYEEFEKPKIVVPAIIQKPENILDSQSFYSNDKTTIVCTDSYFVLAVMNSKVTDFS